MSCMHSFQTLVQTFKPSSYPPNRPYPPCRHHVSAAIARSLLLESPGACHASESAPESGPAPAPAETSAPRPGSPCPPAGMPKVAPLTGKLPAVCGLDLLLRQMAGQGHDGDDHEEPADAACRSPAWCCIRGRWWSGRQRPSRCCRHRRYRRREFREKPCGPLLFRPAVPQPVHAAQVVKARMDRPGAGSSARRLSRRRLRSSCPGIPGVRPTIRPAMKMASTTKTSMPYMPAPTPPKITSPV